MKTMYKLKVVLVDGRSVVASDLLTEEVADELDDQLMGPFTVIRLEVGGSMVYIPVEQVRNVQVSEVQVETSTDKNPA